MYKQMMEHLKAVGGYFPKPNPNADPHAKVYDPSNLSDQGEGGDPEVTGSETSPAGKAKRNKAGRAKVQ